MRAAVVTNFGVPRYDEFDDPRPGPGQAVVEVLAAGVNNVDAVTARGGLINGPVPPFVAGREGVGLLEGRRVYFDGMIPPYGSMAELALVDPATVYDLPDDLSDGMALALGIAGLAGWVSLAWRAGLRSGERVLVLGASGVVGQIAIQAARLLGAGHIVAAARSVSGQKLSRALGADEVVALDGNEDDIATNLRAACDPGADVTIDLLGGSLADLAVGAGARHGRYVQVGNSAGPALSLRAPLIREKMVDLLGYTTRHAPADVVRAAYQTMVAHALAGDLAIEVEEHPLSRVEAAWQRLSSPDHHKLVLRP